MADEGIRLEEHLAFQRREWAAQRVGTWFVFAFVGAAALGLFGSGGLFSRGRADAEKGNLSIEYERFARIGAPARLEIHSVVGTQAAHPHELQINRAFFDTIRTERILPEPQGMVIESDTVTFQFDTSQSGALILDYQPLRPGRQLIQVRIDQSPPVSLTQFTYF